MKLIIALSVLVLALIRCTPNNNPSASTPPSGQSNPQNPPSNPQPDPVPAPTPSPQPPAHVALSWENTTAPHPERAPWSDALIGQISKRFDRLDRASDLPIFCPTYTSLPQSTRIKAWAELMVADAYYESGYDPSSSSVDVGNQSDKNTWSIGLWQLSVVDQAWVGEDFKVSGVYKYNYDQLLTAQNNADLGMAIMARQIVNKGVVAIPVGTTGLYWATPHPGGKYDQTDNIVARVKKNVPECQFTQATIHRKKRFAKGSSEPRRL